MFFKVPPKNTLPPFIKKIPLSRSFSQYSTPLQLVGWYCQRDGIIFSKGPMAWSLLWLAAPAAFSMGRGQVGWYFLIQLLLFKVTRCSSPFILPMSLALLLKASQLRRVFFLSPAVQPVHYFYLWEGRGSKYNLLHSTKWALCSATISFPAEAGTDVHCHCQPEHLPVSVIIWDFLFFKALQLYVFFLPHIQRRDYCFTPAESSESFSLQLY